MTTAFRIDPATTVNYIAVSSGPSTWKYCIHEQHAQIGWKWRIDRLLEAAAFKRVMYHLPFGQLTEARSFPYDMACILPMDPDRRYGNLVTSFAPLHKPLVQQGFRFEIYVGALGDSEGMRTKPVAGQRVPLEHDDWCRRALTSIKPFLDLGEGLESIDVDAAALLEDGSKEYYWLCMLRSMLSPRATVRVEALPANAPHYEGWAVTANDRDYLVQRQRPGALKPRDATRIIDWAKGEHESEDQLADRLYREIPEKVGRILKDGHTPALDVLNLKALCPGLFGPAANEGTSVGAVA